MLEILQGIALALIAFATIMNSRAIQHLAAAVKTMARRP